MRAFGLTAVLATAALLVTACAERADAQAQPVADAAPSEGGPYVLKDTQVWTVPDPVSGRDYEVFVSLPASYEAEPQRRYPTLYVTDADAWFDKAVKAGSDVVRPCTDEFFGRHGKVRDPFGHVWSFVALKPHTV